MENADESVCTCVCVCSLYNHVYGCACVDVGGTSMSVLERQNSLGVYVRILCKQLKNPFQNAVLLYPNPTVITTKAI